jgi:transposase
MTAEERIASLEAQLEQVIEQWRQTQEELRQTREQLAEANKRIEELEKQKTPPAAFVQANVKKPPEGEKKPRKKRDPKHTHARRREKPTRIVEHPISRCEACGSRLEGVSVARRRQVIELPEPSPVEVTEHVLYHGWCSQCQKWRAAPLDVSTEVIGQGRMGVRLGSLIAYLRTVLRLPVRQIQRYLASLHGLHISSGEIVELLHRLTRQMQPQVKAIQAAIRASPAVQADETGWREDGKNGYIWSLSTAQLRCYQYHHSRGHEVVEELLGPAFEGVLGSDFYAAYNVYAGLHQRCWVHFLRDVHELKQKHPQDEALWQWAADVKALYQQAIAWAKHGPDPQLSPRQQKQARVAHQHAFEQQLLALCRPFVGKGSPQETLCQRVERFLPELFVFVAVAGVPAHNNLAERSVRPVVIARKISGGSRSPKGSDTRMDLSSLFGTWLAQGLNPFFKCLAELSTPHS